MEATPLPEIAHCNMLTISRKSEQICGRCVVNPALSIPEASLQPLTGTEPHGVRQNLYLAAEESDLQVQVWVADVEPASVAPAKTRLAFHAGGCVFVNLRCLGNQPCAIVARSELRNVYIVLPRDFVGALSTHSKSPFSFIPRDFKKLSEMGGKGRYFRGSSVWNGTTLSVSAPKGRVSISFGPEPKPKVEKLVTAPGVDLNAPSTQAVRSNSTSSGAPADGKGDTESSAGKTSAPAASPTHAPSAQASRSNSTSSGVPPTGKCDTASSVAKASAPATGPTNVPSAQAVCNNSTSPGAHPASGGTCDTQSSVAKASAPATGLTTNAPSAQTARTNSTSSGAPPAGKGHTEGSAAKASAPAVGPTTNAPSANNQDAESRKTKVAPASEGVTTVAPSSGPTNAPSAQVLRSNSTSAGAPPGGKGDTKSSATKASASAARPVANVPSAKNHKAADTKVAPASEGVTTVAPSSGSAQCAGVSSAPAADGSWIAALLMLVFVIYCVCSIVFVTVWLLRFVYFSLSRWARRN